MPVTQVACIVVVPVALLLGAAYILVCMSRQSFRKVNNAVKDGRLGITELDRFDVANYKFALRRIAKGGAFFRRFYEADDVPVAKLDDGDYIKKVRVAWKLPKYPAEKISSEEKKQ